jgi:hypothetical protein
MVHALHEIWRVLKPGGDLIDIRSISERWPVEVVSARSIQVTGHVQDLPDSTADDEAANRSIAQAAENGWFTKEQEEFFTYDYSWDSPDEMEDYIKEEWEGSIDIDEATMLATSSVWALADADARVRLRTKIMIARWRRNDG